MVSILDSSIALAPVTPQFIEQLLEACSKRLDAVGWLMMAIT
jgi:hypothetical protein